MIPPPPLSILHHFAALEDPRVDRTRQHHLLDLVAIALCGVICGANNWSAIVLWGGPTIIGWRPSWSCPTLSPPTTPSAASSPCSTPSNSPPALRGGWPPSVSVWDSNRWPSIARLSAVATTAAEGQAALHLLTPGWSRTAYVGRRAVDGKSNEITAIPALLQLLDVAGALVTIDAMGCHKDIAADIRAAKADSLLAVKDNQPLVYEDIEGITTRRGIRTLSG